MGIVVDNFKWNKKRDSRSYPIGLQLGFILVCCRCVYDVLALCFGCARDRTIFWSIYALLIKRLVKACYLGSYAHSVLIKSSANIAIAFAYNIAANTLVYLLTADRLKACVFRKRIAFRCVVKSDKDKLTLIVELDSVVEHSLSLSVG